MDFKALHFLEFAALDARVRNGLRDYFGVSDENEAAMKWLSLTSAHDDQAANLLAVATALARVAIRPAADTISALDLVTRIHLLTGDRLYAQLSNSLFEAWKQNAAFEIALPNGKSEKGTVKFNHGQFGASLHEGFDIQGVTTLNRIPRIQWNYRFCDSLADIDLDGYSPWDIVHHPTYANSDPRQWNDKLVGKFGRPGYEVQDVGNVPEVRVKDTSTCPRTDSRLTGAEQAAALATASAVMAALERVDGFRSVVAASATTLAVSLRDTEQSPLVSEIAAEVLLSAGNEDLLGYYAARVNLERLMRISPLVVRPLKDALLPISALRTAEPAISTAEDLDTMRRLLEQEEERQRVRVGSLDAGFVSSVATAFSMRAWLSTDNEAAFGYPPGTRFVAVETGDLQLLVAPENEEYVLLFAVPRTKH